MIQKLFICFLLLLTISCSKTRSTPPSSKPLLLVSIAPYRFLTEQIAGSDFNVQTIVPSNTNPHSFEPTLLEVVEMAQGEVWLRVGEPFETKILPVLMNRNPNLAVLDLREGIPMIEEGHLTCSH